MEIYAKNFEAIMRSEVVTAIGKRKECCLEQAEYWKRAALFHRKYKEWPWWLSTLFIPIWVVREYNFIKGLAKLSEEYVELTKKHSATVFN